jgi:hypothetical protein
MENKTKKPKAQVLGKDPNVFILVGICSRALKLANQSGKAKEMREKIWESQSYNEALQIMGEYCELC